MYFQEEEVLPTLVPINRKKKETVSYSPEPQKDLNVATVSQFNVLHSQKEQSQPTLQKKLTNEREQKQIDSLDPAKIGEFDSRFKVMNEEGNNEQQQKTIKITDKWKQNQKSKVLIGEMMFKINAKNISEELYPVTNETIEALMKQTDAQIHKLSMERERKQNSLALNDKNLNLRQEVETLKSSIDRAVTIKELYQEKINQRNKIMTLEKSIIQLKEENSNLKIKINRGVETIQKHMHNLPCEKQKELFEELDAVKKNWKKEKEMREKLESNISEIVLNFKRLYEEADTARLIVTKKLKELEEREKLLSIGLPAHSIEERQSQKNSPSSDAVEERAKMSIKAGQLKNYSPILNKTPPRMANLPQNKQAVTTRARQPQRATGGMFSFEDQIKKMRNNQHNLVRNR